MALASNSSLLRSVIIGDSFGHSDAQLEAMLGLCAVATAARCEINGPHDSNVICKPLIPDVEDDIAVIMVVEDIVA